MKRLFGPGWRAKKKWFPKGYKQPAILWVYGKESRQVHEDITYLKAPVATLNLIGTGQLAGIVIYLMCFMWVILLFHSWHQSTLCRGCWLSKVCLLCFIAFSALSSWEAVHGNGNALHAFPWRDNSVSCNSWNLGSYWVTAISWHLV